MVYTPDTPLQGTVTANRRFNVMHPQSRWEGLWALEWATTGPHQKRRFVAPTAHHGRPHARQPSTRARAWLVGRQATSTAFPPITTVRLL